jgi:hypothetical protein
MTVRIDDRRQPRALLGKVCTADLFIRVLDAQMRNRNENAGSFGFRGGFRAFRRGYDFCDGISSSNMG